MLVNISLFAKHTDNIILKCQIHGGDKSHWGWISLHKKLKKKWKKENTFLSSKRVWTLNWRSCFHEMTSKQSVRVHKSRHAGTLTSCTFFLCKLYTESSPVTQKRLVTVGWYYRDRNRQVSVAKDQQRDSRYLKNGVIDLPLPVIYSFFQWLTAAQFIRLCCVRNIWIDT